MAGVEERYRRRITFVLLLMGLGLILTGFALQIYHRSEIEAAVQPEPVNVSREARIDAMKQVLFWLLVFVLIFAVSTFAFLRWSRHFRNRLLHVPHPPSPSDDVWAMHRLPEELEPSEPGLNPDGPEPDEPPPGRIGPDPTADGPDEEGGQPRG